MIVLTWTGARPALILTNVKLRLPYGPSPLPADSPPGCPDVGVGRGNPHSRFQIGVLRMVKSIESSTGPMHAIVEFFVARNAEHAVGNGHICRLKPTVRSIGDIHHLPFVSVNAGAVEFIRPKKRLGSVYSGGYNHHQQSRH